MYSIFIHLSPFNNNTSMRKIVLSVLLQKGSISKNELLTVEKFRSWYLLYEKKNNTVKFIK